jgi:hypothetical protein
VQNGAYGSWQARRLTAWPTAARPRARRCGAGRPTRPSSCRL